MPKDEEFTHESLQDVESVVKYLKAICDGFENGLMIFGKTTDQVMLQPQGLLKLNLEVKRKKNRSKLTVKVTWTEGKSRESDTPEMLIIRNRKKK
ncbi:MAG: amphi-Trp domain-containing protein [Candidatus Coatesbacteria bacterium]|nr:amphi-Trp domain-containing protein [Candidatus Coatesbacteria bacterium]